MEPDELYLSLGLAIAAGLLIGIERELSAPRASADGSFLGGARTHPLVALVAGLSRLAHGSARVAVLSIFVAAASNTAVKAILAARLGGWAFGRRIASAFAVVLAAGAVTVGLWVR